MNKVIIVGNIASDPEAHTTQSGISRSSFRVAVTRPYKRDETDFLPVVAWRQAADYCNKYLKKGNKVAVEGSIQVRSYDAQDGTKRYVTEIIADSVEGLTRSENGAPSTAENTNNVPDNKSHAPATMAKNGFQQVEDNELPF